MIKSIEVSGKTEDEAVESALERLGLTRDDVSVEIIERAKTGFLGLKNSPAVVKVLYESKGDNIELIETFLSGLFERMEIEAGIELAEEDGAVNVVLTSKDPGVLIGRRGETLDAIQHLTNYVVNRGGSGRVRVNLDAENYRQRRNETLESLAARTAGKVMKYRRNMTLDPMNAYERHVIHTALQNYESISTYSVGSEPNRRIVVAFGRRNEGGEQGGYSDRNASSGRGGYGDRNASSGRGGHGERGAPSGRGGHSDRGGYGGRSASSEHSSSTDRGASTDRSSSTERNASDGHDASSGRGPQSGQDDHPAQDTGGGSSGAPQYREWS